MKRSRFHLHITVLAVLTATLGAIQALQGGHYLDPNIALFISGALTYLLKALDAQSPSTSGQSPLK